MVMFIFFDCAEMSYLNIQYIHAHDSMLTIQTKQKNTNNIIKYFKNSFLFFEVIIE